MGCEGEIIVIVRWWGRIVKRIEHIELAPKQRALRLKQKVHAWIFIVEEKNGIQKSKVICNRHSTVRASTCVGCKEAGKIVELRETGIHWIWLGPVNSICCWTQKNYLPIVSLEGTPKSTRWIHEEAEQWGDRVALEFASKEFTSVSPGLLGWGTYCNDRGSSQ